MTGQSKRGACPEKVLRRHFEMGVFSQLLWDLKSGDLYVEGGDQYADYRVIRTHFLLHYLGDPELRSTIQSATNKSEAFNGFAKWAFFGGEGVITHNRRVEQRKCIKFNHLVANCLIFYNVHVISEVLEQLNQEGAELDAQAVGALSPYLRQHINRF